MWRVERIRIELDGYIAAFVLLLHGLRPQLIRPASGQQQVLARRRRVGRLKASLRQDAASEPLQSFR